VTSDLATTKNQKASDAPSSIKPVTATSKLETSVWRSRLNVILKVCDVLPDKILSPFKNKGRSLAFRKTVTLFSENKVSV
jgi:hypothetical protein